MKRNDATVTGFLSNLLNYYRYNFQHQRSKEDYKNDLPVIIIVPLGNHSVYINIHLEEFFPLCPTVYQIENFNKAKIKNITTA